MAVAGVFGSPFSSFIIGFAAFVLVEGLIEVPLLPWQDHGGRDLGSICCAKDGLAAGSSYQVTWLAVDG